MRKRLLVSVLTTICLLAVIAVMNVGLASAAPVKAVGGPPNGAIRPHVDPNATITDISISFLTHDDNKDFDTSISVSVQEPVGFFKENLARLSNFAGNTEFKDSPPSIHTFDLPLTAQNVKLSDLSSAPIYQISIVPNGHDTWIFDVTVTITASDGSQFSTQANGVRLTQDNRVFNGSF